MYAAFQIIYRIHMYAYKWCFSTICECHLISLVIFLLLRARVCVESVLQVCEACCLSVLDNCFFPSLETDEVYKILFACLLFAFLSNQIIPFHGILLLY